MKRNSFDKYENFRFRPLCAENIIYDTTQTPVNSLLAAQCKSHAVLCTLQGIRNGISENVRWMSCQTAQAPNALTVSHFTPGNALPLISFNLHVGFVSSVHFPLMWPGAVRAGRCLVQLHSSLRSQGRSGCSWRTSVAPPAPSAAEQKTAVFSRV